MRRKTHQLGAGYGRGYSRLGCGSPVFSDHSGLQHQKGTNLKTKVSVPLQGKALGCLEEMREGLKPDWFKLD